jgi:hypothetical protein
MAAAFTLLSRLDADDAAPPASRSRKAAAWRPPLMRALGGTVMACGLILMPLPGPFGLPVTLVGLMLLLKHSYAARRRFVGLAERWPRLIGPVRRRLHSRARRRPA